MTIIFFIKSSTIDISKYTIKDIPGSSGRLDVISRCVLAAILGKDNFEKEIQIHLFLDRYGTFIFEPDNFDFDIFPKNEILFTDYFVDLLQKDHIRKKKPLNPLSLVRTSKISMIEAIRYFQNLNYSIFILKEGGINFLNLRKTIHKLENVLFVVGSQEDEFLDSKELLDLKIPIISLGNQSYLASSVIRLLKLCMLALP
jgi:tRNA (pseudouridine54-N1)-methyltransferase